MILCLPLFPSELSFAVPVANALSFLCTLLTGKLLGEEFGGKSKSDILSSLVLYSGYVSPFFSLEKLILFLSSQTAAEAVVGMFLTMAGITLCVISSIDEQDPRQQNAT